MHFCAKHQEGCKICNLVLYFLDREVLFHNNRKAHYEI